MDNIIDGKKISKLILDECKIKIENLNKRNLKITLAVIQVGNDISSTVYRNAKKKKCMDLGIDFREFCFDENEEENIINCINTLNNDKNITGIFIEMPLPKNINMSRIINQIDYKKDVDCLTNFNIGQLVNNNFIIAPCTAYGVIKIFENLNIDLKSKNCVIMGRSNTVGKPLMFLLLNNNATVTITHSNTKNIKEITKTADILIVSIGKANFVKKDFIKENAIVIDVGINQIMSGEKKVLVGDVDFDDCKSKASLITPVPGGVGAVTTNCLIYNLIKLKENYG